jgi:epoxide hydrolase-like predicted phosphatase
VSMTINANARWSNEDKSINLLFLFLMSQIKYIFRDFWWVVGKIDIPRKGYVAQLEKMYNLPKETIFQYLTDPINKFRRWEISEKENRNAFSKNIQLPIHKNIPKLFNSPPHTYAALHKSTIAFVKKLQERGYKCVILSDEWVPQSNQLRKAWWYDGFDDVLLSCEIGLSKHDDKTNSTTKIFTYALKKYAIKPWEVIFVDDVEKNCEVAKKLWMQTVVAASPRQTIRDIKNILKI